MPMIERLKYLKDTPSSTGKTNLVRHWKEKHFTPAIQYGYMFTNTT